MAGKAPSRARRRSWTPSFWATVLFTCTLGTGCGKDEAEPEDQAPESAGEASDDDSPNYPSELDSVPSPGLTPKSDEEDPTQSPSPNTPDPEEEDKSPESSQDPQPSGSPEPEKSKGGDKDGPGPAGTCGEGGKKGSVHKIELGSAERYYWVGAPDKKEPLPMVVAFHGDEGDPANAVRSFWEPVWRKEQSFVLVMVKCPGCTSWYKGDTKANAQYLWDVLEDVGSKHNIDVSRIYGIGYSGGSVFLALHGFEFQNVFAAVQWHCGGGRGYHKPPRDDCKVRGRIVISKDDFLWDSAKTVEKTLESNGHSSEFVTAECEGHCCHTSDLAVGAWAYFQKHKKCGAEVGGSCAEITDLP